MVHVVLDTNILVSALWSKDGNPAKIAHFIPDGKIVPFFCGEILNEYNVVLSRPKFGFPQDQINALLDNIKKHGKSCNVSKSAVPFTDENDRIFYDVARESKSILVTGNIKHFPTEPFIMTPAEFLAKIRLNP